MKYFLYIFAFFLLVTQVCSAQWFLQNPSPTNACLTKVKFISSTLGWVVGSNGTILRTTNGGTNWIQQTSGTTDDLTGVSFTDANTGTVVGYRTILRTTDGGTNWIQQTSGTTNALRGVSFTDANHGTVVGGNGTILRTTDGGTNWIQQTSGTTDDLTGVSFTDANTGTVVGDNGTILRTIDGGTNWIEQTSGTTSMLNSVCFTDENTGWVVGWGVILKTTDGGTNWIQTGEGNAWMDVCFTDANNGTVVGIYGAINRNSQNLTGGRIIRTTDGGNTWTGQSGGESCCLRAVSFIDANNGWIVDGGSFTILTTADGGVNWAFQAAGVESYFFDVCFTDANNGTVVGWNALNHEIGVIYRTTDGGTTWTLKTIGVEGSMFYGVSFTDANTGTVVGDIGIFRTTDGGINWIQQTSGTTSMLNSVCFTDANNGTVVGGNGTILRTTNGGTNWIQQTSGTTDDLTGVSFTDTNTGTVVGWNGIILRTTDGGTNWIQQTSGTTNALRGVSFTDANHGTVVGGNGTILRTTNEGINWIQQTSGTIQELYDVSFANINVGVVVGRAGTILRTIDGGTNWIVQISGTTEDLRGVSFTDANTGTVIGGSMRSVILRTTNGGGNPVTLPSWTNQIIIEDAGGMESSEVLTFGQHPDATDSIDAAPGEYELPPLPPTGIFDARFNLPTNPQVSSLIDYRDSAKTDIIWTMQFQPGTAGYPMTFSWDSTAFPEGTFYLKDRINGSFVNVNMKNQNSYILTNPVITSLSIIYKGVSSIVDVNDEWNMISVPLLAEDMSLNNLFPTATSLAYGFEGSYVTEDTLLGGKGYWLKFDGNQQVQIYGSRMGDTVPLETGWNMFGVYENDIPVTQLTTTPPGIIATYFFEYNDGYYIADTLKSGQGFWVRVTSDGTLNLNSSSLMKDGEQLQFAEIDKNWGKIIITNNKGKSITLFATEKETDFSLFELPPMPPTGIFDVRFNSGKFVEDLSSEKVIIISSDNYPITIRAEGINLTVRDRINGELLNEDLNDGEEIRITNNKITAIVVAGTITSGVPVSYELYQNYPNPFNPNTTIKFAIPREANVNLSIYNVLGELVTTLVNEEMKPGYYEYEFNASALASGVYLYRINAGDFVETKKMVLMK